MIKINLLPVRAAKKKETFRQQVSIAVMSLVMVLIIIGYLHVTIGKRIEEVNAKIAADQQELAKTKEQIGEISKFKETKKVLEDKLGVIETLKKGRGGPVRALDDLSRLMPEKLWINNFKEGKGLVSMDGVALSNETIALFMTELDKSPYFKDIELIETAQVEQSGMKLKKFSLTCKWE